MLERPAKPATDEAPEEGAAEALDVLSMEGGCDMKGDRREWAVAVPTGRNLRQRREKREKWEGGRDGWEKEMKRQRER